MTFSAGFSFVVPVHNGAACIRETLAAIFAQNEQNGGRAFEVIVVDDCSTDESSALLYELARQWPLRIVAGEGRGAAAAINTGVRAARYPIICQVDQDVVVQRGWIRPLADALADPSVAAAQGYYATDPHATLCARAMSLDLEQRYAAIDGAETGHVCTGNTAYRASALHEIGLFDESFGYGYDNDMSYRLRAAGYTLRFCRDARSVHRWREGFAGYLTQQYGFGYGRIDLVAKHPTRFTGDSVSRAGMMSHPVVMAAAMAALGVFTVVGTKAFAWLGVVLLAALALERLWAGVIAAQRFGDPTPLIFPLLHLGRDAAWVAAITIWTLRRALGRPSRPAHSMRPRPSVVAGQGG